MNWLVHFYLNNTLTLYLLSSDLISLFLNDASTLYIQWGMQGDPVKLVNHVVWN